ncbi:unnamed protein product, partial [Prorocentrum cordatum]
WRAFGPITSQQLLPKVATPYSRESWTALVDWSVALAVLLLPLFSKLHRFVHDYFRVSLLRAFYCDGKDVPMEDVKNCPRAPVLLFGTVLNDFQRPEDDDPHAVFVLTQHAVGCERTKFIPTPEWLTLSKCMTLSSAAIDGLVLTKIKGWHARLLMAMLNLTQGDTLRFDAGEAPRCPRRWRRAERCLDRAPEALLWSGFYLSLMLASRESGRSQIGHVPLQEECSNIHYRLT